MRDVTVRQVMSTDVVTLEEEEDLDLADTIMTLGRIRHLPVVSGEKLVGLVSQRDLLGVQASQLADLDPDEQISLNRSVKAKDVMTRFLHTVGPDEELLEAARRMRKYKLGCLPVVNEAFGIVGIITETDFVDLVIEGLADKPAQRQASTA